MAFHGRHLLGRGSKGGRNEQRLALQLLLQCLLPKKQILMLDELIQPKSKTLQIGVAQTDHGEIGEIEVGKRG